LATILVSRESFVTGSVTPPALSQENSVALATAQRAPVLAKVRHGLTTANLRSPTSTDDEGKINSPSKS
jgi:hypothetical protein